MKEPIPMLEMELIGEGKTQQCAHQISAYNSGHLLQLEQELKTLRSEIAMQSHQTKCAEHQRNQALTNAERLLVTFKNYKEEVGKKLTKVIKSENRLKQTLIVCDQERAELEERCAELEREKAETHQTICHLKERCGSTEAQKIKCSLLQNQLQDAELKAHKMKMDLNQQQEEIQCFKRKQQELHQVIASQKKQLTEQQREINQKVLELHSLEEILHLLHLREGREGALCVKPCLLSTPCPTSSDQVNLETGVCYQQLLSVLQHLHQERNQQVVQQRELKEQLKSAQKQLTSMETTLAQRANHYQNLHSQLLDKASHSGALEKELNKMKSCLVILRKQLLEKGSAYSQAIRRNYQLEQELQDRNDVIKQCKTVLDNKQREFQQTLENMQNVHTQTMTEHLDKMEALTELRKQLDHEQEERHKQEKLASRQAAELTRKERALKEADHQAAHLSSSIAELSAEMVKCRGELADMELELQHLRRDCRSKASQLCQMEEELQQTHSQLKKKSEIVILLEEKLHRSELNQCNSLQQIEILEEQLQMMRTELANALQQLQELRNVLQHTELISQQQQADMDKLSIELRESQTELEQRNLDVFNMDAALKEHQGELQMRARMLGQLDVLIHEHNLKMESKVLLLQETLEKTEANLRVKNREGLPEVFNVEQAADIHHTLQSTANS